MTNPDELLNLIKLWNARAKQKRKQAELQNEDIALGQCCGEADAFAQCAKELKAAMKERA